MFSFLPTNYFRLFFERIDTNIIPFNDFLNWNLRLCWQLEWVNLDHFFPFSPENMVRTCPHRFQWPWIKSWVMNIRIWSKLKLENNTSSAIIFIFLPAFYLIMCLMKSPKNFEKRAILKMWELIFFWGVKIHFGEKYAWFAIEILIHGS